jgi:uncharacterized protein (DUF952 family)
MALFKILSFFDWQGLSASGRYDGSADDLRDGYIHLCADHQLEATVDRHFAGMAGLVVAELAVDEDPALRWEPSRRGELFPHLYRSLVLGDLLEIRTQGGPRCTSPLLSPP